jgi:Skp family chaperone for outer membrane proteins
MRRFLPIAAVCLAALCAALFVFSHAAVKADDQPKPASETAPANTDAPAAPSNPEATRAASEIAVIDMDGVLVNYKKYKQQNDAITARQNALTEEIKAGEQKVEELKRKRDAYAEGSQEWWNNDKEYQKAAAELESKTQQAQAEIDKLDNDLFVDILNDIDNAMSKYCPERSIKIVLWKKKVDLNQPTAADRARVFSQLNVLYVDKELDITAAITEMLNKKFEEENKQPANPAAPPQD